MKQKELVPKRRFEGFTGEWKKKQYNDLLDKSEGIRRGPFGSALKKEFFVSNSNYVVYEQQNAIHDRYKTRYNITKQKYNELYRFSIKENDFIMSGAGTIGRISRVPRGIKPGVINQALIRIRVNKQLVDLEYFLQWMRSEKMQDKLTQANPASAMVNLVPMSEVKEWEVSIPTLEEQQKIGDFFKRLDEMIELEQRKINKTKALKNAYLAEMFPAEGERVPKRRFKGFDGEWRTHKIGDIFTVTRGSVLAASKVSKFKTSKMQYPVYSSQTLNDGLLGYYNQYLYKRAITWTTDGANAGTVKFRPDKFYSTNVNGVLLSDTGYACLAVAEGLNLIAWKHVTKVGNPKLMNDIMSEIYIKLPIKIEELNQISRFLDGINNKITLYEKKLEKLKAIKQAYLHEMFV